MILTRTQINPSAVVIWNFNLYESFFFIIWLLMVEYKWQLSHFFARIRDYDFSTNNIFIMKINKVIVS